MPPAPTLLEFLCLSLTSALMASLFALWWAHRQLQKNASELALIKELSMTTLTSPSILSHEIRTPLSLIAGAAELLAEETAGPLSQNQRHFVDIITENSKIVIDMSEEFLSATRIQSQLFKLHLSRFDMRLLAQNLAADARALQTNPIRLDAPTVPVWVHGDRKLLRQALWNLVNNAVRHSGRDAEIRLRVAKIDSGSFFSVTDEGEGISFDNPGEVFTPFQSGAASGTGLGLAITEKIIRLHGGKILVDSSPHLGSAFFVSLPNRPPVIKTANTSRES